MVVEEERRDKAMTSAVTPFSFTTTRTYLTDNPSLVLDFGVKHKDFSRKITK